MNNLFILAFRYRYLVLVVLSFVLVAGIYFPAFGPIAGTILVVAAGVGILMNLLFSHINW